jgi:hypothetical protein
MANSVSFSAWCLDSSHAGLVTVGEAQQIGPLCYSCHAPTAFVANNVPYGPEDAREGVTCAYCHSIAAVSVSAELDPGEIEIVPGALRGTRTGIASAPHAVAISELHGKSELCAACHYFAWPQNGMPIDWTYPQWQASPQARAGQTCQSCHMPRRPGRVSEIEGAPQRADVAAHTFHGGRDLKTLRGALRLGVKLKRRGDGWIALVRVANVGAGHNVPGGGGGLRSLDLEVRAKDAEGREVLGAKRAYRFSYLTANGTETSGMDPEAARLIDTSIRAGERRIERFPLAGDRPPALLTAQLRYWYVVPEVQERSHLELDKAIAGPVLVRERSIQPQTMAKDSK